MGGCGLRFVWGLGAQDVNGVAMRTSPVKPSITSMLRPCSRFR